MLSKFTTLTMLAATWVVVVAVPAGAQAQTARMRFESMDQNRDGAISRDEWRGSDRAFQNQDWNGDGQLSGNEVRIGARRDGNFEEADHLPNRYERYVSWTTAGFNNLDHNRDRRISANEWHFDLETFRRVDRNRDGSLEPVRISRRRRSTMPATRASTISTGTTTGASSAPNGMAATRCSRASIATATAC